jgi:hypothetical protein
MYDGHEYFRYLRRRHAPAVPSPVAQEQEGSYFCLTSPHYQIIGIDTAYDWEHDGQLRDTRQAEWLADRIIEGRRAGRRTILLSQHEPFQLGVAQSNPLLKQILSCVTVAGQCGIDYWFWGDEHYCALYRKSDVVPFFGCCIGHGGHPIYIQDIWRMQSDDQRGLYVAKADWVDDSLRFPGGSPAENLANNGFCRIILAPSQLDVEFVDWYGRSRKVVTI